MIEANSKPNTAKLISDEDIKACQFYKVYNVILDAFGSQVAILIALLASKQNYFKMFKKLDSEGYFYLEHKKITEMTGISTHYQKQAMEKLQELNLLYISPKKKGTPPKKFYRVDIGKYNEIIQYLHKTKVA
jgi:DNA-directed RNA polymerase specialized sigma54-like protein